MLDSFLSVFVGRDYGTILFRQIAGGVPVRFRQAVPPGVRTVRFVNGRSFGALRESSFRRRLSVGVCRRMCFRSDRSFDECGADVHIRFGGPYRPVCGWLVFRFGRPCLPVRVLPGSAPAGRVARYACCPVPLRRDVRTARVRAFLLPVPFSRRPPAPEADGIASFFGSSAPPWAFRPGKHRIKFVFTPDFSYLCGN